MNRLKIWNAHSEPGEPICVATDEGDLEVEIYLRGDHIAGVIVNDSTTGDRVAAAGWVSAGVVIG